MIQHLLLALLFGGDATTQQFGGERFAQSNGYVGPELYAPLFERDATWSFDVSRRVEGGDDYDSVVRRLVTCGPSWVSTTEAGSVSIISCDHPLDNPIAGTYVATAGGLWRNPYPVPNSPDTFASLPLEEQYLPAEPVPYTMPPEERDLSDVAVATTVTEEGIVCRSRTEDGCASVNTILCFSAEEGIVEALRSEERDTYFLLQAARSAAGVEAPEDQPTPANCEEWVAGNEERFVWGIDEETVTVVHVADTYGGPPGQTIRMLRDDGGLPGADVRVDDFNFDGLPDLWIPVHIGGANASWRGWTFSAEADEFVRAERFDFDGRPSANPEEQLIWNHWEEEEDVDSSAYRLVDRQRILVRSRGYQDAELDADMVLLAGRMAPAAEYDDGDEQFILQDPDDWPHEPALCPGSPYEGEGAAPESLAGASIAGARPGSSAAELFGVYGEPDRVSGERVIEEATGEVTVDWHYDRCGFSATITGPPGVPSSVRWISATTPHAATTGIGLRVGMTEEQATTILGGERFFDENSYESLIVRIEDGLVSEITLSAPAE